jgi:hypothetical protein
VSRNDSFAGRSDTMDAESFEPAPRAGRDESAERRSRGSAYQALKNITREYLGGVPVLRGRVETYYPKQVAQTAVAQVEGVGRSDDQIRVVAAARHPRRD